MAEGLNKAQQTAVDIVNGTALVVAGAGTGKTRVITERIMRLIASGVPAESILALTFTEKAAGEMVDRVDMEAALGATISTFNGFGQQLLEQYGPEWGLTNLRLLSDVGEQVFVREHLDDFKLDYFAPLSNPTGQLGTLCDLVGKLKQELVLPETYQAYADSLPVADEVDKLEKQKHQEAAFFYAKYVELTRAAHVITYDDQIFLTIQLLEARPNILRTIQERYRYVLVDEFQDTNTMQSKLIDLLAGEQPNLMVVGDDDQAIYGWRGATLANILDFKKRYPETRDVALIENYRSTQKILDAAYTLIQNNNPNRLEVSEKLDKHLHAQTDDGPAIARKHFYIQAAELTWVAEDIAARLANGDEAGSIAVLARGNNMVGKVHQALEASGVPHVVVGVQDDLYKQPAVEQLIQVLTAVADPTNSAALFYALSGPAFALPQHELSELSATAKSTHATLTAVITASSNQSFKDALALMEQWRTKHASTSVSRLSYDIITDSGWKGRLYTGDEDPEAIVQGQALSEFFGTLRDFENISTSPSVRTYLDNLDMLRGSGEAFDGTLSIDEHAVNIMSVHKSKGLEWDTVYVVDLVNGSFPLNNTGSRGLEVPAELLNHHSGADDHLAEERRAMYVAVTRARRELILSYGDKIKDGGRHRKQSVFLTEMFGETEAEHFTTSAAIDLEAFAPTITYSTVIPGNIFKNGVYELSASQIECYLDCPLDFYYKHILNIPEPEGAAAGYGTAIHGAIQYMSEQRLLGRIPTFEEILEMVETNLPKGGFASEQTRARRYAGVHDSVQRLYDRFSTETPPVEVEKKFNVTVPDMPVRIKGRMDAVYALGDGMEIRDYKTSDSVRTDEKAHDRAVSSKQLTVYALAWQLMHDELPARLTLDFVETGAMGSVRKQASSLETLKKNLAKMVQSMQTGVYPLGARHDYCSHPAIEN